MCMVPATSAVRIQCCIIGRLTHHIRMLCHADLITMRCYFLKIVQYKLDTADLKIYIIMALCLQGKAELLVILILVI